MQTRADGTAWGELKAECVSGAHLFSAPAIWQARSSQRLLNKAARLDRGVATWTSSKVVCGRFFLLLFARCTFLKTLPNRHELSDAADSFQQKLTGGAAFVCSDQTQTFAMTVKRGLSWQCCDFANWPDYVCLPRMRLRPLSTNYDCSKAREQRANVSQQYAQQAQLARVADQRAPSSVRELDAE